MSSIVKRVQITQKRCSSAARNLAQKRFRKLNRMSDLRAMRSLNKQGIGNDLSERPPNAGRKRSKSGRCARRHWNCPWAHFKHISNRLSKLETELAKKECLFSQCFPKKNDITSTHFLQSILFHPDGLLIEAVTDREMFWLELAPAGWARFDKVASHQDGKVVGHATDRGIFALRELQSTREPWPEGSTMTLAAFLWPRLVP